MSEYLITNKKGTFEKVTSELGKPRDGLSVSKKLVSFSKKKTDKTNSANSKPATGNLSKNLVSTYEPIRLEVKKVQVEELTKIKILEEKITDYNEKEAFTELIKYAKKGDRVGFMSTIDIYFKAHGDISRKDSCSWTILHHAVFEGNLKIVDIILKTKINIESTNNNKQTPLHLAVQQGYFDITKKLIEHKSSINCLDDEKNNVLHYCSQNGHLELLKYLLEKSPTYLITEKNIFGKSPKDLSKDETISNLFAQYLKPHVSSTNNHRIQIHDSTKEIADFSKKMLKKSKDSRYAGSNRNNININISTNIENINNIVNQVQSGPSHTNSNKNFKVVEKSPKASMHSNNNKINIYNSSNNVTENIPTSQTPVLLKNGDSLSKAMLSSQNSQIAINSYGNSLHPNSNNHNYNNSQNPNSLGTSHGITTTVSSKNIKNTKVSKSTSNNHKLLEVNNSQNYNQIINRNDTNTPKLHFSESKKFTSNKSEILSINSNNSNTNNNSSKNNEQKPVKIPITQISLNKDKDNSNNPLYKFKPSNSLTNQNSVIKETTVSANPSVKSSTTKDPVDYENMSTKKFNIPGAHSKSNLNTTNRSKNKVLASSLSHNSKKEFIHNKKNFYNNLIHKEIDLYSNNSPNASRPETTKKITSENFNNKNIYMHQNSANNPNNASSLNTNNSNNKKNDVCIEKVDKLKQIMSHKVFETPQKITSKSKLESTKEKKSESKNLSKLISNSKTLGNSNLVNYTNIQNNKIKQSNKSSKNNPKANPKNNIEGNVNYFIAEENEDPKNHSSTSFKLNLVSKKDSSLDVNKHKQSNTNTNNNYGNLNNQVKSNYNAYNTSSKSKRKVNSNTINNNNYSNNNLNIYNNNHSSNLQNLITKNHNPLVISASTNVSNTNLRYGNVLKIKNSDTSALNNISVNESGHYQNATNAKKAYTNKPSERRGTVNEKLPNNYKAKVTIKDENKENKTSNKSNTLNNNDHEKKRMSINQQRPALSLNDVNMNNENENEDNNETETDINNKMNITGTEEIKSITENLEKIKTSSNNINIIINNKNKNSSKLQIKTEKKISNKNNNLVYSNSKKTKSLDNLKENKGKLSSDTKLTKKNVDLDISNKQIITDSEEEDDSSEENNEEEENENSDDNENDNDNDNDNENDNQNDNQNDTENKDNIDLSKFDVNSNTNNTNNTFNNSNLGNETSSLEERVLPTSFICHALIGKGSFGEVYLVEKINSKTLYAMKVLSKDRIMGQNLVKYAMTERNVLSFTNHPFIVKLNFAFQTIDRLFLILDYCPGGDLSEHICRERKFTEDRAKFYLCQIVLALEDLHKRDIIFRDLKPDNVVLDQDGNAMLTDFGLSKEGVLVGNKGATSFCGSLAYLAPEMLKQVGHGKSVDWYLLGVIFYEMLAGMPPYFTDNKDQLFKNIEKAELVVPRSVSENAADLLRKLLSRDPVNRLGAGPNDAEEVKAHKYFKGVDWDAVYNKRITPPKLSYKPKPMHIFSKPRQFEDYSDLQISNDRSQLTHFSGWSFINKFEDFKP